MGLGWRSRNYGPALATAISDDAHFNRGNGTSCGINQQHIGCSGNATPEEYRPHLYDLIFAAGVRSDGTLRASNDTPPSELRAGTNTALLLRNQMHNEIYRLGTVIEPQRALGLLWVVFTYRGTTTAETIDHKGVFETLRNNGVPISAMISQERLPLASTAGASGVVFLLPHHLTSTEVTSVQNLVSGGVPVVALSWFGSTTARGQLPAGVTIIDLPDLSTLTPTAARTIAQQIQTATGTVLSVDSEATVYGFRAKERAFMVVQNLHHATRTLTVRVKLTATGITGTLSTVNMNDNSTLTATVNGEYLDIPVTVVGWDAALILLSPTSTTYDSLTQYSSTTNTDASAWSYRITANTSTPNSGATLLPWDAGQNGWCSAQYVGVWNYSQHPDSTRDVLLRFKYPASTTKTVHVKVVVSDGDIGGTGQILRLYKNDGTQLWSYTAPANFFATPQTFETDVALAPGDYLYYRVNANGDFTYDTTLARLTVTVPN